MRPQDLGPIYTETLLGRFPVEPWNTYSNVIFLICILVFTWKTKMNSKRFPLLVVALPILTIGFIGGTVFHATRSHRIWLLMDFLPIFLLTLLASYYFWRSITPSIFFAILGFLFPVILFFSLRGGGYIPPELRIPFGYASLAALTLLPAFIFCYQKKWRGLLPLTLSIGSFILALTFRTIDKGIGAEYLSMGTHFLWHIFGGVSVFLLFEFLFVTSPEA